MIHCIIGAQFLVISLIVGHGVTPLALTHQEQTCRFGQVFFVSLNLYFKVI
jgi:hypothetical protein